MAYRTKADHIRSLLASGASKKEAARLSGASYTQVHGIWQRLSGNQQAINVRNLVRQSLPIAKPFPRGTRVVHKGQLDKSIFGIVLDSGPGQTIVRFPGPTQLKHPAYLVTGELELALGKDWNGDSQTRPQGHPRSP